ncbi:MAG: GIY-YIG nuclease family protein [Patescibacteria group bacterium]
MFWYTYVLRCRKAEKLYVGFTGNLKRRLEQHKSGQVHSTKRLGNCELIFYEAFVSKEDAQRREKYLKTTKGKRTLKLMLKKYFAPIVPRTRA